MKKTEKLSRWLLILIVFEVLLLLYCLFFARGILLEEGLFFVLGLFSAIVLSDLLLTWTILLSFAFGIVFLVAGVVYIPFHQALLLLFSFPALIGILLNIRYHLFKEIAKVKEVLRKQSKSATIYLTFPFFSFILSLPHEILRQPLPGQSNV